MCVCVYVCVLFYFFPLKSCWTLIYLAVLGLCYSLGFSLVVASRGYCLVAVCRLLVSVTSLVGEHRV